MAPKFSRHADQPGSRGCHAWIVKGNALCLCGAAPKKGDRVCHNHTRLAETPALDMVHAQQEWVGGIAEPSQEGDVEDVVEVGPQRLLEDNRPRVSAASSMDMSMRSERPRLVRNMEENQPNSLHRPRVSASSMDISSVRSEEFVRMQNQRLLEEHLAMQQRRPRASAGVPPRASADPLYESLLANMNNLRISSKDIRSARIKVLYRVLGKDEVLQEEAWKRIREYMKEPDYKPGCCRPHIFAKKVLEELYDEGHFDHLF